MTSPHITFDLSPREIADAIIAKVQKPEDCYEESPVGAQLIPALAPLKDHVIDGIGFLFKKRFAADFSAAPNQRWWKSIRAERERQRGESHQDSPYILTSTGNYTANLANAITMLTPLPIRYNSFAAVSFLSRPSPWGSEGNWTDYDDAKAAEWCQHQGLNIDVHVAATAVETIARNRKPHYHPITDYLSSLEWDGTPRCDRWMIACLGAEDTPLIREMSAKWLIAAVKRVFEPRCQSDYTLVLEGQQGKRKSNALRELAGSDFFTDDIGDISDGKGSAEKLQGKWIVELAELDAFRRAAMTTIKSFLTRREDRFRPSYGRRAIDFPRQNVFAASTNREDWGLDDTGLRRFWPVKVGEIDIDKLAEHRDQIWAEAYVRYQAGEITWLTRDGEDAAVEQQSMRQESDSWDDAVIEWTESPSGTSNPDDPMRSRSGRVLLPEILQHCLGIPRKDWTPFQRQRVSRILRLHGYVARRAARSDADEGGKRPEFWERGK